MMRLLVTGARGQLGLALAAMCQGRDVEFRGIDLPEYDITDAAVVAAAVHRFSPQVIVNCAAFTAVDAAEEREAEARRVNAEAVGFLAQAADAAGSLLVQISTDYVFDGSQQRPYREDDPCRPLQVYGRTKLEGEQAARRAARHLIVRTAWLYGEGHNFVRTIRRQLEAGSRTLTVVADQFGCPTYAGDLADAILRLVRLEAEGVVHVVNDGYTSWHGLACEIVRLVGSTAEVVPVETAAVPRPARRPSWSVLDTTRLSSILGAPMPPWRDALARYLASG
jgi:dTDP-4-dehydrorhamnose reductase